MENNNGNNGDDWLEFIIKYLTSVEVLTSIGLIFFGACILLIGFFLAPSIIGENPPYIYSGVFSIFITAIGITMGVFMVIRREAINLTGPNIKGRRAVIMGIIIIIFCIVFEAYNLYQLYMDYISDLR